VALYRPRPSAEAYLRLRTLPGEQSQVDWAHFGRLAVGRALRPLMAFVMVLSYSRQLFLRFYLGASMSCFLDGHVQAFNFFQGVSRQCLYDFVPGNKIWVMCPPLFCGRQIDLGSFHGAA
jgi:transposase